MDEASEDYLRTEASHIPLQKENRSAGHPAIRLVAEDVEKVNPDLVVCDPDGAPLSGPLRAVNAMLLNEFLKEHKKTEK